MHEADTLRVVDALVLARPEELLQLDAGHHVVIDAVTVFLFPLGFEDIEARGQNHGLGVEGLAVAQYGMEATSRALNVCDFGIQIGLDVFHPVEHGVHHVLGGMEGGKQPVPLCDMATQRLALLDDDGIQPHLLQLRGGLHSGGATAND